MKNKSVELYDSCSNCHNIFEKINLSSYLTDNRDCVSLCGQCVVILLKLPQQGFNLFEFNNDNLGEDSTDSLDNYTDIIVNGKTYHENN